MQQRKSTRHQRAANARWRKADQERADGIPDREPLMDARQCVTLDLRSWGGKLWRIEPRFGYVAGRAVDEESGKVEHCAAIKELLRLIARDTPRTLGWRNLR